MIVYVTNNIEPWTLNLEEWIIDSFNKSQKIWSKNEYNKFLQEKIAKCLNSVHTPVIYLHLYIYLEACLL